MRVLVSGASGFVAGHLFAHLTRAAPAAELFGLVRPGQVGQLAAPRVVPLEADLGDASALAAAVATARTDRVVHLAALSSVHESWARPADCFETNVRGLQQLLHALAAARTRPRVLVVGSADEYGAAAAAELPLREDAPLRPRSPYAVSKVAQGLVAQSAGVACGLEVVRTRTFPHTGPGRGEQFAESSFARQLAEIESGLRPPVVRSGNLDAVRDFSDVRDVVDAYWRLLERGAAGACYNVCSGRGVALGEILDRLCALSGCGARRELDPSRLRPSDVPVLVGDAARLRAATGWEPTIALQQTLRDLLEHWRGVVRERAASARA